MARIIDDKTETIVEVEDGENLRDACESLGIPFGCQNGICGTCMIDIIEGEENLTELTESEIDLERDKTHRLACQCNIKKGDVRIGF